MEIRSWDERYSSGERAAEDIDAAPTSLLVETSKRLTPARALDLACGSGRNALWLAEQGWSVTAADGSPVAIEVLQSRASNRGVTVNMKVADLEKDLRRIEDSYYAENDLNYRDNTIQPRFAQTKRQLDDARRELSDARDVQQKAKGKPSS